MSQQSNEKKDRVSIFCDGACSGNPGPGGWGAIIASEKQRSVWELGGRQERTTNNQMELTAVIQALEFIESFRAEISIYTDSTYVIRGITEWIWAWQKRGWKTQMGEAVANQEEWRKLLVLSQKRETNGGYSTHWHYVRGHSGIPANERVDAIAVEFSQGGKPTLYHGSLENYSISLQASPENLPKNHFSQKPSKPAYSYLSLLDGVLMRHSSWKECEQRVKGRSNAKFRKAESAEEEAKILKLWGVEK